VSASARIDHPRLHWGVLLTTLVVFGFSLWATYFITQLSRNFVARQARSSFDQETVTTQNQIKAYLNEYLGTLRATQGLVLSSQEVERQEWEEFITTLNLPTYYPGMSDLALVEKVSLDEQEAFVDAVRNDTSLQPQG
jgi:two-component system, sensor histidine kinase and response regulator